MGESFAVWASIWWAVSVESAATEWQADGTVRRAVDCTRHVLEAVMGVLSVLFVCSSHGWTHVPVSVCKSYLGAKRLARATPFTL